MKKQKHYVRKIKRKVLSLILVTALITTGLNLEAMSQSIYALNWSSIFVTLKLKKSLYYRHLFSNGVRYPFDECGRI